MNDFISVKRAGRILAPISQHPEHRYFEGGEHQILRMLGQCEIRYQALAEPPYLGATQSNPLTQDWFAELANGFNPPDCRGWGRKYYDWSRQSLLVSRADVLAKLSSPSGRNHPPIENVDAVGASWSFPQTLAWIATRDIGEVARIRYGRHWEQSLEGDDAWKLATLQSDSGRRTLIGWLVLITSLNHCACGSAATDDSEAWESCECVGRAYEELRTFAKGAAHPLPEYRPEPVYGSFTLIWPDSAYNLRFTRSSIMAQWPAGEHRAIASTRRSRGRPPGHGKFVESDRLIVDRAMEIFNCHNGLTNREAVRMAALEVGYSDLNTEDLIPRVAKKLGNLRKSLGFN